MIPSFKKEITGINDDNGNYIISEGYKLSFNAYSCSSLDVVLISLLNEH